MNKSLTNRLNKRITIMRPPANEDVDEYGQPSAELQPVATIWASIEPLRGREFFAAGREAGEVTTRIRIRYRDGINRTMIARYGTVDFEIASVIHPEYDKRELQLMCKEMQ